MWQRHYIVDTKMNIEETEPKKEKLAAVQALIRAVLMLLETGRSLIQRQLKLFRFLSLNVCYKSAKCIRIWCVVILSVSFSNSVFWCHLKMARGVFWRLAKKKNKKNRKTKNNNKKAPNKPALISKTSPAMKSQGSAWVSYCKSLKKMGIHGLQ